MKDTNCLKCSEWWTVKSANACIMNYKNCPMKKWWKIQNAKNANMSKQAFGYLINSLKTRMFQILIAKHALQLKCWNTERIKW